MNQNQTLQKVACGFLLAAGFTLSCEAQTTPRGPVMGWASWNNYHVHISEQIIRAQTDAMAANGMKAAGYTYINMDDGFFGGRDAQGRLLHNRERFPKGMKAMAQYIHRKGLKAGIYSDAGINTCGCHYDHDTISVGCGLYGHDHEDLQLMMGEWGYDFIKVDWCGANWMGLDEETRYREIGQIVRDIRPTAIYNVCRWQFPGKWVTDVADSWRISGDIRDNFNSIMGIVDKNADLWPYCSAGHFNDMDMLQVGRGMSYEEDKTHFTMWCMMVSPLMAGNDLTDISDETLGILTNRELIAIDQDPLFYQARRISPKGDLEVWAKPLIHTMSGEVAVTLLNRTDRPADITLNLASVGLQAAQGYTLRDLWSKEDFPTSQLPDRTFTVPAHGVVTLRIKGTAAPFNKFQTNK